jgi:transglutaminase-like putative cysteine protease
VSLLKPAAVFAALVAFGAAPAPTAHKTYKTYKTDADVFRFRYEVKVPDLAQGQKARLWVPLAHSDAFQKVERTIEAGGLKYEMASEQDFGDEAAVISAAAADSGKVFAIRYEVNRHEKAAFAAQAGDAASPLYKRSDSLVPVNERFRKMATQAIDGKKSDIERGRALYDYVLSYMKYDKSGDGWGRGDAVYACDAKTGNCTDFHALFIAMARSLGIPARFAVGFTIPADKDGGVIEGYHCWAEFLAAGKWVPVDISEAWKDKTAVAYYFGHQPANRFEITSGRDLVLKPAPASGPINFFVHPLAEIDGKIVKKFTGTYVFERLTAAGTPR